MSDTPNPPVAPPAAKKSGAKWIVLLLVLLIVGGGGGAAAWWFFLRPHAAAPAAHAEPKKEAAHPRGGGIVALDQFLVNLADKDAQRFVRVTMRLVVETKEEAEEIAEDEVAKTRLRSAILELLTLQTADTLTTPEGKAQLKKAIAERATPCLDGKKVLDVLFTDFVVQY